MSGHVCASCDHIELAHSFNRGCMGREVSEFGTVACGCTGFKVVRVRGWCTECGKGIGHFLECSQHPDHEHLAGGADDA